MSGHVLSLFPGIGLLDMAFEEEGFCVVRGPDLLWGGDVRSFSPPAGRFDGIIGGPPCQAHSRFKYINAARGLTLAEDLTPEFVRVVASAAPAWWLMENAPAVPDAPVPGYIVDRVELDNRWLGEEQERRRAFQFGTRDGRRLRVATTPFQAAARASTCLASEGRAGRILRTPEGKARYTPRRSWPEFCRLQGLPADFLADAPLTNEGRYRMVGNGVPLAMGRAVARAVKRAITAQVAAA
jgi:DNA (cytosine-5)-methyltransferase 1